MTVFDRDFLKQDFPDMISFIQSQHVMGPEIEKELFVDNKPVEGLCHQRGYFVIWGEFYLQYYMSHVIQNIELQLIGRRVDKVIVYDNYVEYERERQIAMNAVKPNEQTGINLN
jgi:hypothetical protein